VIEDMRDGTYRLVLQNWDDGKGWNYNFPADWTDYDTNLHLFANVESAKREGNAFLVTNAAQKTIELDEKTVAWFWKKEEPKMGKMPSDNLICYDDNYNEIWNLHAFFEREETCTSFSKSSDTSFSFQILEGSWYEIDVVNFIKIEDKAGKNNY
jgi:hypothetical protein